MYNVFQNNEFQGTGTLTECIEYVAASLGDLHPELVTDRQAVEDGYSINKA